VLIYPEGTRFTESKRLRAIAHLGKRRPDLAARAEELRHVLPPRLGGPVALLGPVTPADVLVVAHTGFDGTAEVKDFLRGKMVRATIRVHFSRHSRDGIPEDNEGKISWLFDRWAEVDQWIHEAGGQG